jgi:hypothetical protein
VRLAQAGNQDDGERDEQYPCAERIASLGQQECQADEQAERQQQPATRDEHGALGDEAVATPAHTQRLRGDRGESAGHAADASDDD